MEGPPDLWLYERSLRQEGHTLIAGLDEVGRGPLAGPVVAACVVLPADFSLEGIRDSKTLSERQREQADLRIRAEALAFGIGVVDAATIDRVNILQASRQAMREAIKLLTPTVIPTAALIDGLPIPEFPCPAQRAIIKGDSLSASIAAASIIAKVYRDRLMCAWDQDYPEYGFGGHKGYGSAGHLQALRRYGPCPLHRRSFAPVAALCRDAAYGTEP
jgi:ribonuclease HII